MKEEIMKTLKNVVIYTQIDARDLRDAMNKIENHILSEEVKSIILTREYMVKKPNRMRI